MSQVSRICSYWFNNSWTEASTTLRFNSELRPVKAIDHFELAAQVFLREVLQHPGINQTLHEKTSILRQTEARQPLISNPLVIHFTKCQILHTHTHTASRTLINLLSLSAHLGYIYLERL